MIVKKFPSVNFFTLAPLLMLWTNIRYGKYSIRRIMMDAQYNFEGKLSSSAVSLLWALLYEIVKQNTEKTEKEHDSV